MNKKCIESESLKKKMWRNFHDEEDKWEGMPEAKFLDAHGGRPKTWFKLGFSVALDTVIKADPAPHEMTAKELLLIEERLFLDDNAFHAYTGLLWEMKIDEAVAYAQKWAEEHPEERSKE